MTNATRAPAGHRFRMWLDPPAYPDCIFGNYESNCVQKLKEYLREGSVCVDVGANLGYFSIVMPRLVGEDGQVVEFEPMPDTHEILCRNIRLTQITKTKIVCAVVGHVSESVRLSSQPSGKFSKTAGTTGWKELRTPRSYLRCYLSKSTFGDQWRANRYWDCSPN